MDFFEAVTLFVGKTVFLMVCIPNVHNGKILKGRKKWKNRGKDMVAPIFFFSRYAHNSPAPIRAPKAFCPFHFVFSVSATALLFLSLFLLPFSSFCHSMQ
jgi:hypothetical protein